MKHDKKYYELLAVDYAERYGIIDYKVNSNLMSWIVSYRAYLGNPRYTVKHIINLDTGEESTIRLQRFNPKGFNNL